MGRLNHRTFANVAVMTNTIANKTKPFSEIPGPKGDSVLGSLRDYLPGPKQRFTVDKYKEALISRHEEFGPIMKEKIKDETVVRIFDPELIQAVMASGGKYPKIAPLLESSKQFREAKGMSLGLGNLNGHEWYKVRQTFQKSIMRPTDVSMYLPDVNEIGEDFIQTLRYERDNHFQIHNLLNYLCKWNMEVAGKIAFNRRLNALTCGERSILQKMIDANFDIFKYSALLKFVHPNDTKQQKELHTLHFDSEEYFYGNGQKLVDEAALELKEGIEKGIGCATDRFLAYLLFGTDMEYKEISMSTMTLFADGLNSTAPTLLFALYYLSKNQDVQQKAFDEVSFLFRKGENISSPILNQLTYIRACIKETFRHYPINLDIKRVAEDDLDLMGYTVPKDTVIELCPFVHLLSEQYFQDPKLFNPDRWLRTDQKNSSLEKHSFVYLPFSHGPRMCVGRRLAEQQLYLTLAKIVRNFKLESDSTKTGTKYMVLLYPERPVTLKFIDRNH